MNEQPRPPVYRPGDDAAMPAGDAWVGSALGGGGTGRPGGPDGDGGSDLLRGYVAALRKRRLLILGITAAAVALALVLTLLSGRVYVAQATFEVQREALRVLDRDEASVENDPASSEELFMQTQFALLKSRSLAEGLVRRLRLDTRPDFGIAEAMPAASGAGTIPPAALARLRFDAAVNKVMGLISAAPLGTSSVIELQAESDNPQLAAAIANGAVDEFTESSMQRRYAASNYARGFLARRLNEIKQRLEVSERQLVQYAEQQRILPLSDARVGVTGASGGGQSLDSASLGTLNQALSEARSARILAEANYRQAARGGVNAMPQAESNPELVALRGQLAQAQADYDQRLPTFKPTFPDMVALAARISRLRAQIGAADTQSVAGTRNAYTLARDQEVALQREVDGLKGTVLQLQNRSIQYTILQREVDTNRALYDALLQRYKEIGVSGGSGSNNVSVIDRARAPGAPARPILWLNLLLALVAGLGLGVAIALILEYLDDTFKQPDDVERKLHLPLLGMTPKLADGDTPVAALTERRSTLSESYQSIRTAIELSSANGVPQILCVTSSGISEGKSTTSMALAKSFADQDKRVLLVDSDLRKPTIHRMLGLPNTVGFSNVLAGEVPFASAVQHVASLGIDVIPCGPTPPNPALLLTTGLRARFADLRGAYDIVLVDGPPVIGLADAPLLCDAADGAVMVVEANVQRRNAVRAALRRLSRSRTNLLGVILTKFDPKKAGHGDTESYMTYYYKYGADRP
ncbi:GumC family protein [Sphingomonas arantia]|uniref:GumC family protein n=1 Tax=Sphingomonas arantia TaxID=1460676 RepID=A0ABW4TSD6_9SPHN